MLSSLLYYGIDVCIVTTVFCSLQRHIRNCCISEPLLICLCLQVGPFIVIAIAANKQDLSKQQIVSSVELQAYAASINALHFGTSAKTGSGLQDLFQEITDKVIAQLPSPGASFSAS